MIPLVGIICPACGQSNLDRVICAHHESGEKAWSATNKVICDLLHRHVSPDRLSARDREDEFWAITEG